MCLIAICDYGRMDSEDIMSANLANSDGIGIAWVKNRKVLWRKGLSLEELNKIYDDIPLPHILHFRLATEGGTSKELCHPFPVTNGVNTHTKGIADKVLFHNGHWLDWQKVSMNACIESGKRFPVGPMSDTRAIAWLVKLYGEGFLSLVENQKFAVLNHKGKVSKYGEWATVSGVHLSNTYSTYPLAGTYAHDPYKPYASIIGNGKVHMDDFKERLKDPPSGIFEEDQEDSINKTTLDVGDVYQKEGSATTVEITHVFSFEDKVMLKVGNDNGLNKQFSGSAS